MNSYRDLIGPAQNFFSRWGTGFSSGSDALDPASDTPEETKSENSGNIGQEQGGATQTNLASALSFWKRLLNLMPTLDLVP